MPINRNQFERRKTMDKLFRQNRAYSREELFDKLIEYGFDVQQITIDRDLRYFKELPGEPLREIWVEDEGKRKKVFTYRDKNFSIIEGSLTEDEIATIKQALSTIDRLNITDNYRWLESVFANLIGKFRLPSNGADEYYLDLDNNDKYSGAQHIGVLYKYIETHTVLRIKYKGFMEGESEEWLLHPYLLKQYNNRWFLFALNHDLNKLSVLALDRIKEISPVYDPQIPFTPNRNFTSEYFNDIIGVTKSYDKEPQKVVLRFSVKRFKYVCTKPIHKSQEKVEGCDYTISILVRWNNELDSTILSFGNDVEVLEPQSLRDHIKAKVAKMADLYKIPYKVS